MDIPATPSQRWWFRPAANFSELQVKKLPGDGGIKPTAEMAAEVASIKANAAKLTSEATAQREANSNLNANTMESNTTYRSNVADMTYEQASEELSSMTWYIQTGQGVNGNFRAGNGDQTTSSPHQYLHWLQLRIQELDSDGTYSPEMFGR